MLDGRADISVVVAMKTVLKFTSLLTQFWLSENRSKDVYKSNYIVYHTRTHAHKDRETDRKIDVEINT